MGSNRKEVRELQKQRLEQQLTARREKLAAAGLSDAQQKKDRALQHLQAEIKRSARAIASIEGLRTTVDGARRQKLERAEKAAVEGPEKKKKKEKEAPQAKEDKKGKKAKKAEKG